MDFTKRDFEEKRNFIRMKIDAPVTILTDPRQNAILGVCRNLSGGGLMVEVGSALPLDSHVEVCIASNHGHNPMLRAKANVKRVQANASDTDTKSTCQLGLEIQEMLAAS